jgi:hypothetical protein
MQDKANRQKNTDGNNGSAFSFSQCVKLKMAAGIRAADLQELSALLKSASENSIRHHTYEYFFKGKTFEYTNDFAQWAGEDIEARVLAENLSSIDPYSFGSLEELRAKLGEAVDSYIRDFPNPGRVFPGSEFYFQESITIVYPAGVKAVNLAEFLMALRFVNPSSIYFHFYEARARLDGKDDFSNWIKGVLGNEELAAGISAIDPFMHDIEGIRGAVSDLVAWELRKEMEVTV